MGQQPTIQPSGQTDESTPRVSREGDTVSGALDMANEKDRALVRQATRQRARWIVPESKRQDLKAKLDRALDLAEGAGDYEGVFSGVKTYLGMAAQDQADDHIEEKNARLDEGKATENVGHTLRFIKGIEEGDI
jgi:hypothetical protein